MRTRRQVLATAGVATVGVGSGCLGFDDGAGDESGDGGGSGDGNARAPAPSPDVDDGGMSLSPTEFETGGSIPTRFTCDGEDESPPLRIEDAPEEAGSLAVVVDDPDAPGEHLRPLAALERSARNRRDPGRRPDDRDRRAPRRGPGREPTAPTRSGTRGPVLRRTTSPTSTASSSRRSTGARPRFRGDSRGVRRRRGRPIRRAHVVLGDLRARVNTRRRTGRERRPGARTVGGVAGATKKYQYDRSAVERLQIVEAKAHG